MSFRLQFLFSACKFLWRSQNEKYFLLKVENFFNVFRIYFVIVAVVYGVCMHNSCQRTASGLVPGQKGNFDILVALSKQHDFRGLFLTLVMAAFNSSFDSLDAHKTENHFESQRNKAQEYIGF